MRFRRSHPGGCNPRQRSGKPRKPRGAVLPLVMCAPRGSRTRPEPFVPPCLRLSRRAGQIAPQHHSRESTSDDHALVYRVHRRRAAGGVRRGRRRPAPRHAPARGERPLPYPVTPAAGYQRAVANGTRTATGAPGARYWQNRADYAIRTRVLTDQKRLEGSETITYTNNSPNPLAQLHVDLTLNHHAPGVVRNEPAEVTGGVEVTRVALDGQARGAEPARGRALRHQRHADDHRPPAPVQPGATVRIGVDWEFKVPQAGASGRMGYSEDDLFFFAYLYPAMAVYDDVVGWHPDPLPRHRRVLRGLRQLRCDVRGAGAVDRVRHRRAAERRAGAGSRPSCSATARAWRATRWCTSSPPQTSSG